MVSQILNFGLPAQIDVQVVGNAIDQDHVLAEQMMQQISQIPGTTDLRIQQPFNLPSWTVNVDRTRAQQVGYSQHDVASDVLTSLSGSFQTSPTFYLNPQNHVSYNIAVQTPQYDVQNLDQLKNFPIAINGSGHSRRSSATLRRSIAARSRAPLATTTPGRSSTYTVRLKAPIWPVLPARSTGSLRTIKASCRAGVRSLCVDRSRQCVPPSSGWSPA